MSEYNRSRGRSRSPIRCYHTSRSEYRCVNDREWIENRPSYKLPSHSVSHNGRDRWIDAYYRKREPEYQSQIDSFKSRVYSNYITENRYRDKLEANRTDKFKYKYQDSQRNSSVRIESKNESPIVLETKLDVTKKDDEYNPDTALRMTLQESKEVKCDFIDLTDDDDDVIFVADSRTSPAEIITIIDNDKEDLSMNLMLVFRQLIVLEEYLKENIVEIRCLFNKALALERDNLNSSKSLLTDTNLKFLVSLMEKIKDDVVSGLLPIHRTLFAKKLINDVIYLVKNAVILSPITEQVDENDKNDVIEMDLDETEQEVPISTVVKEPEQSQETPKDTPEIEEQQSISDVKIPVDISKYDNKRMKIAVDIGKALLASGKKIVTAEELDALVNVYIAVTADMSDSESDEE